MFQFRQPFYFIKDPETIKQLAVKEFDHFEDRSTFVDESVEKLLGNSLIMLKGQKWKDMRATLSPAFTGSKMRKMLQLVVECADEMSQYFQRQAMENERKSVDYEMKDLFSKYTNDVISTTAFGIKTNSFENENNEFRRVGKKFQELSSPTTILKVIIMKMFPVIAKMLNIRLFDMGTTKFFRTMVLENIATREKQGIFRPDMINILMNIRNGNSQVNYQNEDNVERSDGFAVVEESNIGKKIVNRKWNDDEIVGQCFLFFLAGFDTTSTCLAFTFYELAMNPNCQTRLYQEICETNKHLEGKRLTYDALQNMKYMDMVISEALRYWPPAPLTDRVCVKDYEYDDGECKMKIEKGCFFWIPIYALHHDEKYFPKPKQFEPERFSEENKNKIIPGTYLPFGIGQRNCIGSRFALMEVKTVVYYLLLHFKVEPNANTQIPLKLMKTPVTMTAEKGINLQLTLRE